MEPFEHAGSSPARVLQTVTPPGLVVAASFELPDHAPGVLRATLTVAWEPGSAEAERMERSILEVAEELLGPDAPLLVRSGEVWGPLRRGDLERPRDPACRGRVFVDFRGDLEVLLDARAAPPVRLDPSNPAHLALVAPGSLVRVNAFVVAAGGCVQVELAGAVAVVRAAPGAGAWGPAPAATC